MPIQSLKKKVNKIKQIFDTQIGNQVRKCKEDKVKEKEKEDNLMQLI